MFFNFPNFFFLIEILSFHGGKCKLHNTNLYVPFWKNSYWYCGHRQQQLKWRSYQNFVVLHPTMYLVTVLGNCHYSCLEDSRKKFLDFALLNFFHNLRAEDFKHFYLILYYLTKINYIRLRAELSKIYFWCLISLASFSIISLPLKRKKSNKGRNIIREFHT